MKKHSTILLKIAIVLIGTPVLALAVLVLPRISGVAFRELPNGPLLAVMVLGVLAVAYLSIIPFFLALYQAMKLLRYIDKGQAFSERSVKSLRKIKKDGWIIAALYTVALPFIYGIAEWDDAPGLILVGMLPIGAAALVAVFANVLERLLEEAIRLKNENDLTV